MHKDGMKKAFIISIGGNKPKGSYEEKEEMIEEKMQGKNSDELVYSRADFGGYTPAQLVSKLEETKNAIANGNAKEALMNLSNCIVRITGRKVEDDKESMVSTGYEYQLERTLPDPGSG
jgi:hypothetical protein